MNLMPYKYFIFINYVSALSLVVLPWLLTEKTSAAILISVTGLMMLIISILSKGKSYPTINIIPVRIVVLLQFILSILLSFSHFLLNFSDQKGLVILIYSVSFLTLLLLTVTNIINQKK